MRSARQLKNVKEVAKEIAASLIRAKKTVAVAESCTGGLFSAALTSVSGSSAYFIGGIVAYHLAIKAKELGVSSKLLRERGAVDETVAQEMARGVRKKFNTDIGVGITGIAGPLGGTREKPVGLVYTAVDTKETTVTGCLHFHGSREEIREKSCLKTLEIMAKIIAPHKKGVSPNNPKIRSSSNKSNLKNSNSSKNKKKKY